MTDRENSTTDKFNGGSFKFLDNERNWQFGDIDISLKEKVRQKVLIS